MHIEPRHSVIPIIEIWTGRGTISCIRAMPFGDADVHHRAQRAQVGGRSAGWSSTPIQISSNAGIATVHPFALELVERGRRVEDAGVTEA